MINPVNTPQYQPMMHLNQPETAGERENDGDGDGAGGAAGVNPSASSMNPQFGNGMGTQINVMA